MISEVLYDGDNILFGLRTGERKSINSELWHACAGPLVSLPPAGSLVVYFPQGHSEQVCHFFSPFSHFYFYWKCNSFGILDFDGGFWPLIVSGCSVNAKGD
jgi:hypothetical protein